MNFNAKNLLLLLVFAAFFTAGCTAQTSAGLSEKAVGAVVVAEERLIEITPHPTTPAPTAVPVTPLPTASIAPTPTLAPTPSPTPDYELTDVKNVEGYVGALSVNLRAGPGTQYKVIGEYVCNTLLTILAKTEDWYQVELDGKTGFMLKEYIGVGAIPTPTPKPTAKATSKPKTTPKPTETPKPVAPDNSGAGSYSAEEVLLTAQLAYEESRRGDYDGYRAVANVILNRVNSGIFRSSIEGVIFQGNGAQFSPADDEAELRSVKPSQTCIEAVQAVFAGNTIFDSDVYYFRAASKGTTWGSHNYVGTYGGNAYFS